MGKQPQMAFGSRIYRVSAVGVMLPRLTDWTDKTDKSRKKLLVVKNERCYVQ